jgi:hypothetical protein
MVFYSRPSDVYPAITVSFVIVFCPVKGSTFSVVTISAPVEGSFTVFFVSFSFGSILVVGAYVTILRAHTFVLTNPIIGLVSVN